MNYKRFYIYFAQGTPKSSVSQDLTKILDKAQQRRDRMKVSVFNRKLEKAAPSKGKVAKSTKKVKVSKEDEGELTNNYSDQSKTRGKRKSKDEVIVLDSGSDSIEGSKDEVIVLDSGSDSIEGSPKRKRSKRVKQKLKTKIQKASSEEPETKKKVEIIIDSDSSTQSLPNVLSEHSDTDVIESNQDTKDRINDVQLPEETGTIRTELSEAPECSKTELLWSQPSTELVSSDEDLFDDDYSASQRATQNAVTKTTDDTAMETTEAGSGSNNVDINVEKSVNMPTTNEETIKGSANEETMKGSAIQTPAAGNKHVAQLLRGLPCVPTEDVASLKYSVSAHTFRVYLYDDKENFLGK